MNENKKFKVIEHSRFLNNNELKELKGGSVTLCHSNQYWGCPVPYDVLCRIKGTCLEGYGLRPCAQQQEVCVNYGIICEVPGGLMLCVPGLPTHLDPCPDRTLF